MKRECIFYNNTKIEYAVILYAKKDVISINVYPDLSVIVFRPIHIDSILTSILVNKKAQKIFERLLYYNKIACYKSEPIYGSKHLYIGRKYTLRVIKCSIKKVILKNKEIIVYTRNLTDKYEINNLLISWYKLKAEIKFNERISFCMSNTGKFMTLNGVLYKRFSNLSSTCNIHSKNFIFNAYFIRFPLVSIDYMIYHSICHQSILDHNDGFYIMLTEVMPKSLSSSFIVR